MDFPLSFFKIILYNKGDIMEMTNRQIINRKTMVDQAIDYLREYILEIDSEKLKLPSEGEIAKRLGISRLTIREALIVLENEGLIAKNQGSSTTITTFARKLAENIDYNGELVSFIEDSGFVAGVDILEQRYIDVDEEIAKKLDIEIGEFIFYVDKLFLANGKPAAMCINRIPQKYISNWEIKMEDLGRSMFELVEKKSNYRLSYDSMELIPDIVTEKLSKILRLEVGSPILRVDIIKYSSEGIPIMYNTEYYVDELIRFTALRNNSGLKLGQMNPKNTVRRGVENE